MRCRFVIGILLASWLALAGRLIFLQWTVRHQFARQAVQQRSFVEVVPARPGEILDRHGRVLATSVAADSLWVDPSRVSNRREFADRIAKATGVSSEELHRKLVLRRNSRFLWVRRRLDEAAVERVRRLKLSPDVAGMRQEFLRRYPQGRLAAHVLGLRDIDGRGKGGIEQSMDGVLTGSDGRRTLIRDARRKVVEIHKQSAVDVRHGTSVILTIDTIIQLIVETELDRLVKKWKPKAAGITMVDPKSGQILAMASRPTYDPNDPRAPSSLAKASRRVHPAGPDAKWKNINISAAFEPGSTIKPLFVAAAIDRGIIKPNDRFHCSWGKYRMGRRTLHDHHPYGELSVKDILVKSSNIGMAKIGEKLTNAGLYEAAVLFGFGRPTGSGLPGEISGTLRPLKHWNLYSTGSVPMGQELSVTPLQLLMAHAALANGGRLISPQIVLRTGGSRGESQELRAKSRESAALTRVVSTAVGADAARWVVVEAMTDVVRRGTGKKARLDDYVVFGKTGTGQKIDPESGRYSSRRHVSSFVGGAPAHDPRVLVLVVVDEPSVGRKHYGGTIAAPAAAEIIRKTLAYLR